MPEKSNAMPPVDLRSDTVTKPTPAMLDRMVHAELGDDGWVQIPLIHITMVMRSERPP